MLIRGLHSSLDANEGETALREFAVSYHAHATQDWWRVVGAPVDLRLQATRTSLSTGAGHRAPMPYTRT